MTSVHVRLAYPGSEPLQRAPALERLLTQASSPVRVEDWRAQAFRALVDGVAAPPVAAAALYGAFGCVSGRWVCMATPVHLVAGMSNVTLSADGVLALDQAEATALAGDFNRVFDNAGVRLCAAPGGLLLCVFDQLLEVSTHDPQVAVGRDVFGLQPKGRDAPRLRRLMSEMELWLFEHAVNRARAAQGRSVITGLWPWGGGAVLTALPAVQGWTAGTDPLFAAFGTQTEFPREPKAARAGVLVCADLPGSATWHEVEQRWFTPLTRMLRAGDIARVTLSVADRMVSVEKRMHWRFWRRTKPWWASFGFAGPELRGEDLPADLVLTDAVSRGDVLRGEVD